MVIAIDGPAGAGKSTVAGKLAQKLNILHLDTGAMYRAAALYALEQGADPADGRAAEALVPQIGVTVEPSAGGQRTFLNGRDVSAAIREHRVSRAASDFSAHPCVRRKMAALQREIASALDMVLDGRDIGTYVLPNADFKFFLTADLEERARRRASELAQKGCPARYEEVLEDLAQRDKNDSSRALAPLKKAEDAIAVDTTRNSADEIVGQLAAVIKDEVGRTK
ncbi:MAG: (d)CMP kinase [Clostridiales bacterium]|jgi:cytidylate kinase|nr:(d)CMP kinase [Clostridiales bacterium]